ncbi:MAG: hypothetical protein Q8K75_00505 [Chlamydiales bacterium]|nr:hypothetical protein [Chlamydiales bacterium]
MHCWSCGTDLPDFTTRIPFKATCDKCHAWLHVCRNCKNYCPGKPNDCLIPGTELIADREKFNLCEEFNPKGEAPVKTSDLSSAEEKLFGSSDSIPKPTGQDKFKNLFND